VLHALGGLTEAEMSEPLGDSRGGVGYASFEI